MKYPCLIVVCATLTLTACGGGGGGSSGGSVNGGNGGSGGNTGTPPPTTTQSDFAAGVFRPESTFRATCANPRPGTSDAQGTTVDENYWLRSWSNDLYLWYDEIIDEDPELYTTPEYFDLMRTFETLPSGAPKDSFHFSQNTAEYQQQLNSGVSADYGAEWDLLSSSPPREAVYVFVQPGTPAAIAGIKRGDRITAIDGVDFVNGSDVAVLNGGLFPENGETHNFTVRDFDGNNERTVALTAEEITVDPVPLTRIIDTPQGPVGYMYFVQYIRPAEEALINAINQFAAADITELVLDIRYNRGGLLDIANELGFMIAGPAAAQGRVFDELRFNDKHTVRNPVTNELLTPTNFHTTAQGFSVANGVALPSLNLSRVHMLVGNSTASANESLINGLRGIDFEVILVGEQTTGKPFGFYPTDNCGETYFTIQFQTVNAKGFGDFAEGFKPIEGPVAADEVQGCVVADDYANELGDPTEARLATALGLIDNQTCATATPVVAAGQRSTTVRVSGVTPDPIPVASPRTWPGSIKIQP